MTSHMRKNRSMELVTHQDYEEFIKNKKAVMIEKKPVPIGHKWDITAFRPLVKVVEKGKKTFQEYTPENSTIWSFPNRGSWATHIGNYRGNWSPFVPRNLILKYTKERDMVLDQMVGSGTTLVECKLLGRNAKGIDINRDAIMVTRDRLNFNFTPPLDMKYPSNLSIETYIGDARNLDKIDSDSIDLIATHPPYAGIITYTRNRVEGDLSSLKLPDYLKEMKVVADESFRVLKEDKYCGVLIGDTRKHLHYIPISYKVMESFLEVGFVLKEDIIKLQWKMQTTREKWRGRAYRFYKIAHEHLYVFRKPSKDEKITRLKNSSKRLLTLGKESQQYDRI